MKSCLVMLGFVWSGLAIVAAPEIASAQAGAAKDDNTKDVFLAPGWGKLSFDAPAAGTYQLPPLESASGGQVLDTSGASQNLDAYLGAKPTLLSFVYRTCDDVNGCPLSTSVLYTVARRIAKEPALKDQLRLLTLSFDPEGDTPEAMAEYEESILGKAELDWDFLTTKSETELKPILSAYQQSVVKDKTSEDGKGKFSHILRVFLIDAEKQIRNIYSLSFLHPDILVNDIKTLIMEQAASSDIQGSDKLGLEHKEQKASGKNNGTVANNGG